MVVRHYNEGELGFFLIINPITTKQATKNENPQNTQVPHLPHNIPIHPNHWDAPRIPCVSPYRILPNPPLDNTHMAMSPGGPKITGS